MNPQDAWQATLGQLQLQLNRATFDTWLKGAELMAYEDGQFIVRVRHAYAKDWLEKHLIHAITQTLCSIFGRSVKIDFVIHTSIPKKLQALAGPLWSGAQPPADNHQQILPQPKSAAEQYEPVEGQSEDKWEAVFDDAEQDTTLNPRYTFESFVVGPNNQFAHAAAQAIVTTPASYNPLFIYGNSGLGKTHLLQAIGHECRASGQQVIYATAEAFTNDLVAAIRSRSTVDFRERYRTADVLLVDDVHFIAGKTSTEEEFYHTLNALCGQNKQIVLACNRHPRALAVLDKQLRSRFEGGLLADIQAPEFETRLAILEAKSTVRGSRLPQDVAHLLASHATSSVRELEGLLTQVLAQATLTGRPLTLALARHALGKNSETPHYISRLDQVLEATATYHQLSLDDLISKRRTKEIVRARHVAIYLAREETEASLPQIGEALGGRDHTTVLHGYQKIAEEVESDDDLRREVTDIRRQLQLIHPH